MKAESSPCDVCGYPGCGRKMCAMPNPREVRAEPWTCSGCGHHCVNAHHGHGHCKGSGAHSGMLGSCCVQEVAPRAFK